MRKPTLKIQSNPGYSKWHKVSAGRTKPYKYLRGKVVKVNGHKFDITQTKVKGKIRTFRTRIS